MPLSHAQGRHIISGDTLRLSMNAARLWTAFAKTRCAQTLARCRTSAALITKCLLSSLQNDMPPLRRYIEQKFPYAMRLLENGRRISSAHMDRSMVSTVSYPQVSSVCCCCLAAEAVMTACCSKAKRQRQRGLQVCFVQRAFLA